MPDPIMTPAQIVGAKLWVESDLYRGTQSPGPTLETVVTTERVAEWLGYRAWTPGEKIKRTDPCTRIVSGVMEQCGWIRRDQRVPGTGPKIRIWVDPRAIHVERVQEAKRLNALHAKWLKENKPLEVH